MIELCSKNKCTGCSSCFNICPKKAIKMKENHEGFLYPIIDSQKCIECRLCQKCCPEINPIKKNNSPTVYASWNLNDKIRTTSSSGGLFYTLAEHIITYKKGIVYGVVFNTDMSTSHISANTIESLRSIQGSKYLQSVIDDTFKNVLKDLNNGHFVMFTGTPCQIAGLRAFLGERQFDNLLLIDIVCHGTPPAKSFKWYLKELKLKIGEFDEKSYQFRNLSAWGYAPSIKFFRENHLLTEDENLFMNLFLKSLILRNSCYECQYTSVNRVSDITLADFWGIGKEIAFNHDTSKGCSLLLVNSEKGKDILNEVSNNLFIEKRSIEEAKVMNHQLHKPSSRPKERDYIFEYLYSHSYDKVNLKFNYTLKLRIRHTIGKIVRALKIKK